MTCWLFQEAALGDNHNNQRLMYLAEELGMTVLVEPFIPDGGTRFEVLPVDQPVVCYGGVGFIKDFQRRGLPQRPFAWCDWEALRCSTYYARWPDALVQRAFAFVPFEDLPREWDGLLSRYGVGDALFLRPDDNDKAFTGEVVHRGDLDRFLAVATLSGPLAGLTCVVARPERILAEWRLTIADRQVLTGSRYRLAGSLVIEAGFPAEAGALAEALARRWSPHPIYSMDLALTPDGYRLLEIGSINCSGFYQCDLRRIATAVRDLAERPG